jgi:hypothetical protein
MDAWYLGVGYHVDYQWKSVANSDRAIRKLLVGSAPLSGKTETTLISKPSALSI